MNDRMMDSAGKPQHTELQEDSQGQLERVLLELPPQYEILEQVAIGGMGSVFKAQNRDTSTPVAIKIMRSESTQNATAMQRFFFEAKAASLLKHPNICRLLDFGVSKSGTPYLVMDWIAGINLEKRIVDGNQLSIPEALLVFKQVAAALAHAHEKRIIHRDLKPENIMINKNADGQMEIQLVDFGVAKMLGTNKQAVQDNAVTRIGVAVGTPAYMSPQQARGAAVDLRTDIYSLGCVMYFTLTGRPPFAGTSTKQVMEKHLYEAPPPIDLALNIPVPLKTIMFKAMNKELVFRYASMNELLADLDKLTPSGQLADEPAAVVKSSPGKRVLVWVLWFVINFLAMYTIVIALQHGQ